MAADKLDIASGFSLLFGPRRQIPDGLPILQLAPGHGEGAQLHNRDRGSKQKRPVGEPTDLSAFRRSADQGTKLITPSSCGAPVMLMVVVLVAPIT
jgi:hypothetical protein